MDEKIKEIEKDERYLHSDLVKISTNPQSKVFLLEFLFKSPQNKREEVVSRIVLPFNLAPKIAKILQEDIFKDDEKEK